MRKYPFLSVFIIALFIASCDPVSYDEWSMPEYDGLFSWTELTTDADWSQRYDHAGVVFNGKMWIFGGYDQGRMKGDTYLEDVWSSTNGEQWTLVTDSAPWKGRRGHSINVFNDGSGNAMYLIGGFEVDEDTGYRQYTNDVWKSTDGLNWTQIKARTDAYADTTVTDWDPRFNHSCVNASFEGKDYLYILGGAAMRENYSGLYSFKYYNDVWRSSDGISWEELSSTDFGERSEFAAFFDEESNRLYLHGGVHSTLIETEDNYNHPVENYEAIWYSDDGTTWNTDTTLMIWRAGHDVFKYSDHLWIFPGKTTSYKKFHMAWSNLHYTYRKGTDDAWVLDSEGSAFNGRHSYVRLIFENKVYVMGGETGDKGPDNDVWVGTINN